MLPVLSLAQLLRNHSPGIEDTHEKKDQSHNPLCIPPLHHMLLTTRGGAVQPDDFQETRVTFPVFEAEKSPLTTGLNLQIVTSKYFCIERSLSKYQLCYISTQFRDRTSRIQVLAFQYAPIPIPST